MWLEWLFIPAGGDRVLPFPVASILSSHEVCLRVDVGSWMPHGTRMRLSVNLVSGDNPVVEPRCGGSRPCYRRAAGSPTPLGLGYAPLGSAGCDASAVKGGVNPELACGWKNTKSDHVQPLSSSVLLCSAYPQQASFGNPAYMI